MRKSTEDANDRASSERNSPSRDERNGALGGQNNWKDEATLIRALKKGDEDAYRYLYRTYASKIGALAKGYLGSDDVDDVVQEVVLRIYKGVKKFRGESKLSTWIYKITLNVCNNVYKKLKTKEALLEINDTYDDESSQSQFASQDDVKKMVFDEILYERLKIVMSKMPPEDRALLYMKEIDNMTYEEISEVLGKPEGTLKSKLHYIKERIKKELREEVQDE